MNVADAKFGAYLIGGIPTADKATINSMALLFDQIYIPFNPALTRKIIEKSVISLKDVKRLETRFFYADLEKVDIRIKEPCPLTPRSIENINVFIGKGYGKDKAESINDLFHKAVITLAVVIYFYEQAISYLPLFGDIVHAEIFDDGRPFISEQRADGMWYATLRNTLRLPLEDRFNLDQMLEKNFFPIVTSAADLESIDTTMSTRSLASLLAMKSIQMFLPEVGALDPYEVLAARKKLSDNLSFFWAGMLRLSKNLKASIQSDVVPDTIFREAQELVDNEIMPAVIELKKQMELERKALFVRLLGPIQSLAKLFVGTATINPQLLAVAALDISGSASRQALRQVEALSTDEKKRIFSFLLELPKQVRPKTRSNNPTDEFAGWMIVER